ncbi:MAG TPA: HPF/RaiA family ribosome-associated protein [Thermodesulfobacteriota bacterium]|nr:HPF/RaiA family ribosome-associated protein [Thermodesulfobacteriota bacterium]
MDLKITIRHEKDARKSRRLRDFIKKKSLKIEKIINQYNTPSEVKIILDVQKFRNKAEIFINSGIFKCTSSVESEDMANSIESAIDNVIKQLKKRIEKKASLKKRKGAEKVIDTHYVMGKTDQSDYRLENAPAKPMSVDEAKLQLDISEHEFVTFYNSSSGEMNVLYKNSADELVLVTP